MTNLLLLLLLLLFFLLSQLIKSNNKIKAKLDRNIYGYPNWIVKRYQRSKRKSWKETDWGVAGRNRIPNHRKKEKRKKKAVSNTRILNKQFDQGNCWQTERCDLLILMTLYTNVPVNEAIEEAANRLYSGTFQTPPVINETFITLTKLATTNVILATIY